MSVYYVLFSKSAKECVVLGRSTGLKGRPFQGSVVWVNSVACFLPQRLLELLEFRFRAAYPSEDVLLLREDELFDSGGFLAADDLLLTVGDDGDEDPPLTKYLPELEREEIMAEILRDPSLRIS